MGQGQPPHKENTSYVAFGNPEVGINVKMGQRHPLYKENTSYVIVGNPGAGKSTLLNGLMRGVNFDSGVSFGEGKTQNLKVLVGKDGRRFIDTPELADIEIRKKAAEEIDKAFKTGGPYTLIFVITLEAGRLRPDDLASLELVLRSTNLQSNKFSVILNKITENAMKKLNESPEGRKKLLVGINVTLPAKTMFIHYYKRDKDIEDEDNKMLKIDEEFQYFLDACPITSIANTVGIDSDISKWKDLIRNSDFDKFFLLESCILSRSISSLLPLLLADERLNKTYDTDKWKITKYVKKYLADDIICDIQDSVHKRLGQQLKAPTPEQEEEKQSESEIRTHKFERTINNKVSNINFTLLLSVVQMKNIWQYLFEVDDIEDNNDKEAPKRISITF